MSWNEKVTVLVTLIIEATNIHDWDDATWGEQIAAAADEMAEPCRSHVIYSKIVSRRG